MVLIQGNQSTISSFYEAKKEKKETINISIVKSEEKEKKKEEKEEVKKENK